MSPPYGWFSRGFVSLAVLLACSTTHPSSLFAQKPSFLPPSTRTGLPKVVDDSPPSFSTTSEASREQLSQQPTAPPLNANRAAENPLRESLPHDDAQAATLPENTGEQLGLRDWQEGRGSLWQAQQQLAQQPHEPSSPGFAMAEGPTATQRVATPSGQPEPPPRTVAPPAAGLATSNSLADRIRLAEQRRSEIPPAQPPSSRWDHLFPGRDHLPEAPRWNGGEGMNQAARAEDGLLKRR